ncbi:hypothetical protein [Amycolatopsis antarctica]|uniref:hypothetical protein n=1 Tax=Amycolatopsis antarctica TaxID=1854586 RepID=UPI0013FD822C|nr:hypothetical protein [Amycolatopsis antarctica]
MSSTEPGNRADPPPSADGEVERTRTLHFNEDWAATIVGLLLLTLVLIGAVPQGLVP